MELKQSFDLKIEKGLSYKVSKDLFSWPNNFSQDHYSLLFLVQIWVALS